MVLEVRAGVGFGEVGLVITRGHVKGFWGAGYIDLRGAYL